MIFQVKGEEEGGVRMAVRSDMGSVYGKKQVDHDIWGHIRRSKRSPPTAPTRNLNAIMYGKMRDGDGSDLDAEDTDEDGEPNDIDDVIEDGPDTKLLTNDEARGEDPSLEEISVLLQKMMREKSRKRQQSGQSKTRSKQKRQAPDSPVPTNRLEAQVLEMQILDAQKNLDRYKQLQSAP